MDKKKQISLKQGTFEKGDFNEVNLSNGSTSLVKNGLIVFEGTHEGMFGPVTLSPEFLQIMVDRFNREYEKPKNENDYPPLMRDHSRAVDDVLGRLMPPLVLQDWQNPRTGETVAAVFGQLRIDSPDAQAKVLAGLYSHLSIGFDDSSDNMGEIFELSFVAVEAARGSQVLNQNKNQGDSMDPKELAKLQKAANQLSVMKEKKKSQSLVRKEQIKTLSLNLKEADASLSTVQSEVGTILKELKVKAIKNQFSQFVLGGKMTKAELDAIDFETISKMEIEGQKALLASYEARPVSPDVVQHGTHGAEPPKQPKALSGNAMRKAIAAQLSGKKLSMEEEEELGNPEVDKTKGDDEPGTGLTMEDIEESLGKLESLTGLSDKIKEAQDRMKDTLSKLAGEDEKEEKEDDDE